MPKESKAYCAKSGYKTLILGIERVKERSNKMSLNKYSLGDKLIVWGSFFIFFIGAPMHFVYEFSGNNPLVGSFGIESLLMDILILFVAILLGQVMALHFYTFTKSYNGKASLGLNLLIILLFVAFTFYPPRLPIFKDSVTKTYGIHQVK